MMKRFLKALCVCAGLIIGSCMHVWGAAPGTTCATAIPLGDNYSTNVSGPYPKSVWYTAWTFDLPLTVYFAPEHETDPAPDVEMDFSCISGYYPNDSILCSLFCKTSGSSGLDMKMPHKPSLSTDRLPDGTFVYYLSLGKKYRDLLLQMGISYNLEVYVKVTYKSNGTMSMAPDDMFTNCMDGPKFMRLGDTVRVKTQDVDRHVIVPYVQWQEDSIRYVWDGTDPVTIAISAECDYDPTDNADERILDFFTLQPQDTLKLTAAEVQYYVNSDNVASQAGMFFAKFYTNGTGIMKIERVPQAPPRGGATLLHYNKVTTVPSDTNALFAIPYTWTKATLFTTPTDHVFKMYIGTEPDFELPDAIATYQFNRTDTCHWWGLFESDMTTLWSNTQEQYLYVRFDCTAKTTIKPTLWYPSDCMVSARLLTPQMGEITINANSTTIYRIYYNDWKDGDMTVYWNQTAMCKMLVSGQCLIGTNGNAASVIYYEEMKNKRTYTIPASEIADWADVADEDGYIYIRFYTTKSGGGKVTMTTTAPEEQDPAPIVYPASTIHVICNGEPSSAGQEYIIRVSTAQPLHIDNGTPWNQSPEESHTVTLQSGVHTLYGATETVQIDVK